MDASDWIWLGVVCLATCLALWAMKQGHDRTAKTAKIFAYVLDPIGSIGMFQQGKKPDKAKPKGARENWANEKVQCDVHGSQQRTNVCQHVYEGLVRRERVGWFWSVEDPDNPRPDAFCLECEKRVRKTDGEWIGEALEHLKPKTLCGACYDLAKTFHTGGDPFH